MAPFLRIAVTIVAVTAVLYVPFRRWTAGGVCQSQARMDGKTVIITGANTGIGKAIARDIAERGARVILACRNLEKAEKAAKEIHSQTGNENVVVRKLDLASLTSVRKFAKEVNEVESRLDVLINNAGVMDCPRSKTEDGFEIHFGVNHLGHFLLTNLLLDKLKQSAPSRVVTVSSVAHGFVRGLNFDDLNVYDLNSEAGYGLGDSYCRSKLANILFSRELSKRLEEEGAQTAICCAVADEWENATGLYFSDCTPTEPSEAGKDDGAAARLWDVSERMVGLKLR